MENPGERFDFDASRGEIDSIQPFERSIVGYLFPHCRESILPLKVSCLVADFVPFDVTQEKLEQGSEVVEGLFARAIATRLLEGDMDSVVTLYHARAAFHRREVDRTGELRLQISLCALELTRIATHRLRGGGSEY